MICSYRTIIKRTSWKSDKGLLLTGGSVLFFYSLIGYVFEFHIDNFFTSEQVKHLTSIFKISVEEKVFKYIELLWHIFWISAISSFLGIPIARIIEGCLGAHSAKQYSSLREKIAPKGALYHCKWNNTLLILQENRHISTLTSLKKYIIDGERLDIPEYSGLLSSIRHIKRISNLLLSVENIMQKEGEVECEKKVSFYRSQVRLLLFRTDIYRHLITFVYFIFPAFFTLLFTLLFEKNGLFREDVFTFFLGTSVIVSSIFFAMLSYSALSLFAYFWRKQCKRFDDMVFKIYALIVSLVIFISVFSLGIYFLFPANTAITEDIKILLVTSSNIILPIINMESGNNLIRYLPIEAKLVLQISTAIIVSVLLNLIFEYALGKYEQSTSGEHERHFSVPAELVGIFGKFFIFIIATALIYSAIVATSFNNTQITSSNITPITPSANIVDQGATLSVNPVNPQAAGVVVSTDSSSTNKPKDINPGEKLGSFLPYSIFLALVGAVLAISTRELLENYFAGVSMKVDMPFQQGDRIEIDNIGMCEVREVGLRSVKLYSIANNSIVSIPNKEISNDIISNYTLPTLDYRRSLKLNVGMEFSGNSDKPKEVSSDIKHDFRFIKDCDDEAEGVVETAKALLLIATFISTGVKKPSAKRFFWYNWILENPDLAIERPDAGMKYQATRDIEKYTQNAEIKIDREEKLIAALEAVVGIKSYHDVDEEQLDVIWSRLSLIQKISDIPLNEIFLMDIPLLLDDISMLRKNIQYMDTDYILRAKIRVAKILYLLYKIEHPKYDLLEQDYAGGERLDKDKAWSLSNYIRCLISQYFSLNELLWGLKSQSEGQAGKRSIDSARLKFQDIPRVLTNQRQLSEGYVYWEFTLSVTVGLGEQSDEVLYNIYKRIDWYWELTNLSKDLRISNSKVNSD